MKELKRIIEDYIKTDETDYAILIKGTWGCGKTHFYKNQLSQLIEQNSLKPVYVSLYGVSKLEDLSRSLLIAMLPLLQKKPMEKLVSGAGVVGSLLSAFSFGGFSLDWSKVAKDFDVSNWVGKNKVLCFDDLERAKLDIGQILGFVNNLVEHGKIKTILIANEDEIVNNQLKENYAEKVQAAVQIHAKKGLDNKIQVDDLYKTIDELFKPTISYPTIKEKLVGRTVEFKPDIDAILDSIINIYGADGDLKSFLDSNRQSILKTFQRSGKLNIRALKSALDMYRVVHVALRKSGAEILHKHELSLLSFVLAVSLEIKTNEARIAEFKQMNSSYEYHFVSLLEKDGKPEPYIKTFCDKYFPESPGEADFNKTVIQYVTDGFFDQAAFLVEVRQAEQGNTGSKEDKIRALFNFSVLDDSTFKQNANDVMSFITKGEISLYSYPHLFEYFQYFSESGLIKESTAKVKQLFVLGIRAAAKKTTYETLQDSRSYEMPAQGERSKEYLEIKKSVDDFTESLHEAHWVEACSRLFELLPDQFEEFRTSYYDQAREFTTVPIFRYYTARRLSSRIKRLRTQDVFQLSQLLDRRYSDLIFAPSLREDYAGINSLLDTVESILTKTKKKTLRIHWFKQLASVLQRARLKLQPPEVVQDEISNTSSVKGVGN
jgi:hypothetical protein